jgi:hypothetical protein
VKPILAIFGKDVRHRWPYIAAFVALVIVGSLLDPAFRHHQASAAESWIWLALPIAAGFLVIAAVHEERLPGDRQYWLARPFAWTELLAAKALFVAAFVNLPILLSQAAVLASNGIPPTQHLSTLLWRQAFLAAVLLLPVAVLASLTRSLKQVVLGILIIAAPLPVIMMAPPVIGKGQELNLLLSRIVTGDFWLRTLIVAACVMLGSIVLLLFQYRSRRTGVARAGFAAVLMLCVAAGELATPERALAIRAKLSPERIAPTAVRIVSGSGTVVTHLSSNSRRGWQVRVEIPVRVEDLPRGLEWLSVKFSGRLQNVPVIGDLAGSPAAPLVAVFIDQESYDRIKAAPVRLDGAVDLVLFQRQNVMPAPKAHAVTIPAIGACATTPNLDGKLEITCYSPFPHGALAVEFPGGGRQWIVGRRTLEAPLPTAVNFEPLDRFTSATPFESWHEVEGLRLVTERPIATIHREFVLDGIRLPRYPSR